MTITTAASAVIAAKRRLGGVLASAAVSLAVTLAGCAAPQASRSTTALPLDQAAVQATDALMAQTTGMAGFLSRRSLVLDPMIDAGTGQQTVATQTLQRHVADRLAAGHGTVQILPFRQDNLAKAAYLLTGTLSRQPAGVAGPLTIRLALTDVRSGNVVAQASALALAQGVDARRVQDRRLRRLRARAGVRSAAGRRRSASGSRPCPRACGAGRAAAAATAPAGAAARRVSRFPPASVPARRWPRAGS